MKKFLISAIAIVLLLFVGCTAGNGNDAASTPTDPVTVPSTEATQESQMTTTETTESPTEDPLANILEKLRPWYQQNNDLVGWIRIPDTPVDEPVMQTPHYKDYYLDKDFYHQYLKAGTLYIREQCDVFAPSDNLTIYGHNMKDNSRFGILDYYKKKSYWKEHQYIYFDTLFEEHTYQIFAVFKTSANMGEGYPYHRFENAETEEEFNEFVNSVKELSFFDTGITPKYGDKLITLSTCEYTLDNGRLVVVAVRVK